MTRNKEIAVGDIVCYKESLPTIICDCEVLEVENNDKEYGFKLKVVNPIMGDAQLNEEFSISAAHGSHAYAGMWRLYDQGEYA